MPAMQGPRNGFYLGVARSNTDFWVVNFQKNYRVNPEIPYELINFSGSLKSFFHSQ